MNAPAPAPTTTAVRPATRERIDRLASRVADYLTPGQLAAFREIVEHELRCQDRDTRHACAEAVVALAGDMGECMASTASQACMNAHAI